MQAYVPIPTIQLNEKQLATIDAAARLVGGAQISSKLDLIILEAAGVLLSKQVFAVNEEAFQCFVAGLATAPGPT